MAKIEHLLDQSIQSNTSCRIQGQDVDLQS